MIRIETIIKAANIWKMLVWKISSGQANTTAKGFPGDHRRDLLEGKSGKFGD